MEDSKMRRPSESRVQPAERMEQPNLPSTCGTAVGDRVCSVVRTTGWWVGGDRGTRNRCQARLEWLESDEEAGKMTIQNGLWLPVRPR